MAGSKFGNSRRATILKYNNDGTVQIALDEIGLQQTDQQFNVSIPLAWAGPNGEFIGGFPVRGTAVLVSQSQGGQWFIESYLPSRGVFTDQGLMGAYRDGRALMQVKGGNRLFVDAKLGIQAGDGDQYVHIDPNKQIFSHNFSADMSFTEAARSIDSVIKRDIKENSNRGIIGSTLHSHVYDESLFTISMDPSAAVALKTIGETVRNPPLVEKRELNYEFADSFDYGSDTEEAVRFNNPSSINKLDNGRKESRADTLSLGLQFPNHLIETIKGTVVDAFGNILDLNRSALPIGKIDQLSLRKNADKEDAFARIRAQMRKSIAYHFEINARKPGAFNDTTGGDGTAPIPDVSDVTNYARNRSRFFIDIDKEGQFKINVPQSSETGNIPLLTRYENYSNLLAKQDATKDPNALVRNKDRQDIFLDSFATSAKIKLTASDAALDGYEAPVDRVTDQPIKLGTAFHDITKAMSNFLPGAPTINLYENNPINSIEPYEKIVEDTIIVSGKDANGGGRSGLINMDGFCGINIGANTVDRQSLWLDCAGGIVSQIGKDKRGISHAMNLDGDLLIQIGGAGLGNTADSRFTDDIPRIGALDIRIMDGENPMTRIRIDNLGIRMATTGVLQLTGQQGILLSTQGPMTLNGERVVFFSNTGLPRLVERSGIPI